MQIAHRKILERCVPTESHSEEGERMEYARFSSFSRCLEYLLKGCICAFMY